MAGYDACATYNAASRHFSDVRSRLAPFGADKTLRDLKLGPGDRVLDVACGTGKTAFAAAELVGESGSVVGIDIAQRMIDIAQKQAVEDGAGNVEFQLGDMDDLEFPEASFDAVACCYAVFFSRDMTSAIADMWRLLRPGGRLVITTLGRNFFSPASGVFLDIAQNYVEDLDVYLPWVETCDVMRLRSIVREAGIAQPLIEHDDHLVRLASVEDWWQVLMGSGFRAVAMKIDDRTLEHIRLENEQWLRENSIHTLTLGTHYVSAVKPAL